MKTARPASDCLSSGSMQRISWKFAETLVKRRAEPRDAVEIREVERHQSRAAAVLSDFVIEFLEPALGARHCHDMRACPGQRLGGGAADAARGAGDECDAVGEGLCHGRGI